MIINQLKLLSEVNNDSFYNAISAGIVSPYKENLISNLKLVVNKFNYIFEASEFLKIKKDSYGNKYTVLAYILPAIVNCYSKFFLKTPTLLKNERLELFKSSFKLEEFLNFLSSKYILLSKLNIENEFVYLNVDSTILEMIVDEYISSKVAYVASIKSENISAETRKNTINTILN